MSNDVLFENEHYKIVVGKSIHDESAIPCYQICNKETEVVEAETTVYPTALNYAVEYAKGIVELSKSTEPRPDITFKH